MICPWLIIAIVNLPLMFGWVGIVFHNQKFITQDAAKEMAPTMANPISTILSPVHISRIGPSPQIGWIWGDPYFLPYRFDEIVRLVRGHHHRSKDAPAKPHQHASCKERSIHQAKSEDGKQLDETDMSNVRNVFERRPPNTEFSEHHELNGIVRKSVFPAARP